MLEPFKVAKFLESLEITIEEYWLCYRIMLIRSKYSEDNITVPNGDLLEFSQLSEKYQVRFSKIVDFKKLTINLEQKGFIHIWSRDLDNFDIKHINVNEKFLQYFYIDDIREAFAEFVELYPKRVAVKGDTKGSSTKYSVWGKLSEDELLDIFQAKILKGNNKIRFTRFMEITKMYLDEQNSNTAPYGIKGYFEAFEGIARSYEEKENSVKSLFEEDV